MRMIFEDLYLFSPSEKKGKKISFQAGLNVITSSTKDGANVGKSVIMRSLYHALGAEALFEPKWEVKNKVFILKFSVDESEYYIYRAASLYKIFDANKKLISVATRSSELAEELRKITDFAVMLPNRTDDKLEITPPVYNYIPYYIDQDHHDGSTFSSFDKLSQYKNYKENVLFCHFGVFDNQYFSVIQEKEKIEERIIECNKRNEMLTSMKRDIEERLKIGAYSGDVDALNKDVNRYKKEYSEVINKLNKSKSRLIDFRNGLVELEEALSETTNFQRKNDTAIKKLRNHVCPECGSIIEDTIELKSKKYNLAEDTIVIQNDIQISIHEVEEKIKKEEEVYKSLLEQLDQYERKMKIHTGEIDDILRYKGFCELRDSIVDELNELDDQLSLETDQKKNVSKKIKAYAAQKQKIEDKYKALLTDARVKFDLAEIDPDKFESLKNNFSASGSDADIATIIWYFTLIKLRNEYNPDAIKYPVVIDSPCNAEMDAQKEMTLKKYLFENVNISSQMILSGIGLDKSIPKGTQANVIELTNEHYQLLQSTDYLKYSSILTAFCNA